MKAVNYVLIILSSIWLSIAEAEDTLGISLFGFSGDRIIDQYKKDPLLLYVTIDNSAAIFTERQNTRNQLIIDGYSNTEEYQNLSQDVRNELNSAYPIVKTSPIVLGSESLSVADLIDIQVRNQNGDNIKLEYRVLVPSKPVKQKVQLDHTRSLSFTFVIENNQLSKLPLGRYHFVAGVDTRKQEDMWQGWAYSNSVDVSLTEQHPKPDWEASNVRAKMISEYLLMDKQFELAQNHALLWTERQPDSVNAWSSLGDALAGQEQREAALDAYNKALSNFFAKNGNPPPELPTSLIKRIDEL